LLEASFETANKANNMKANQINYSEISQKVFLTLEEAAHFTGLSKSYIYKLTSRGKIPHSKPQGKLIFFERVNLENWMRQGSSGILSTAKVEEQAAKFVTLKPGGLK